MIKTNFSVLDRANLRSILAEHKLTAKGLIDPDTAKQLGQFAGVDALILGTITPKDQNITLTAKIITTDTAEIVGAAKAAFKTNDAVHQLLASPATETGALSAPGSASGPVDLSDDKPKVVKSFGDLRVELQSLKIINGGQYFLTMTLTNCSTKKSLWVALANKTSILSPNGYLFGQTTANGLLYSRLYMQYGSPQYEYFNPATEIKPGDSTTVTITISSTENRPPSPGVCTLQMQFLLGDDFLLTSGAKHTTSPNLVTKFEAK